MKFLLTSSALAAALAVAPAFAQQATVQSDTKGTVTVQGIAPSQVLGAIDTSKLVTADASATAHISAQASADEPPTATTQVTVETTSEQTAEGKVETEIAVLTPVTGRPTLDAEYPIAPEVQAVVNSGKKYTTKDIVLAQLEAVRNTPVTTPTTVITTTTTTPAAPG